MLGKVEGRRSRGMTEEEMVGWHHRLNEHDFEQALGVGDGQGSLACCSPWGHKELDTTERLNKKKTQPDSEVLCQRIQTDFPGAASSHIKSLHLSTRAFE